VTVETIPKSSVLENEELEALIEAVDLVCVTDWDRDNMVSFFTAQRVGLNLTSPDSL